MRLAIPALLKGGSANGRKWRGPVGALLFSVLVHLAVLVLFVLSQVLSPDIDGVARGPGDSMIWLSLSRPDAVRAVERGAAVRAAGEQASTNAAPASAPGPMIPGQSLAAEEGPPAAGEGVDAPTVQGAADARQDGGRPGLDYQQRLLDRIRLYRRYPDEAGSTRPKGVVRIGLVLERSGRVLRVWVVETSGHQVLDRAAVDTIWKAEPLPVIPPELPDQINVVLPIDFSQQTSSAPAAPPHP